MKRSVLITSALILAAVFAVGAWLYLAPTESADRTTVRVGYLPIAAELPFFVAIEQGYFDSRGIDVELQRFTSSNELGNAATAGHIDVMAGTATNVIFDIGAVSGDKHRLFVINPYSNTPGHVTDYLLVGNDSAITELSDLTDKRIASFPGSVNRIFVNLILEKHGIPRSAYTYLEMPPPNWQPALASGAIDAVSALEPAATQIMADGVGRSIFDGFYADLMPDVPLSGHWVASNFVDTADPGTIRGFVASYRDALAFINDNEEKAREYLADYANVRPDILQRVGLNPWQMDGEIDSEHLQDYADLLFENGALRAKPDVTDFLLPAALN